MKKADPLLIAPQGPSPASGQEVFTIHTAPICELIAAETGAIESVIEGTGATLEELSRVGGYVSWDSYSRLCENLRDRLGDDGLDRLSRRLLATEASSMVRMVADSFGEPMEFLRWLGDSPMHRGITCIGQKTTGIGSGRLQIESRMNDGYEPSEAFWLIRRGFLASVSELYGDEPAEVGVEISSRSARYEIRIPAHETRPAGLWNRLRRWFTRSDRDAEFLEGVARLHRRHEELQARLDDLEQRERQLAESQQLFEQAFRESPITMLISRVSDGQIIAVNDQFLRMSGFGTDDIVGKRATEAGIWPSTEERDRFRALRGGREGGFEGEETLLIDRHGRQRFVLLSAKTVTLTEESCVLWQAVDISDRKEAENRLEIYRQELERTVELRNQELEQSRVELRQSDRLATIGTLAAGIAHEINNPIGSIMLEAEYALAASDDDGDRVSTWRAALESCLEQAQRCGEIVRSVLQFSRGVQSKRALEDLRGVVTRSCEMVSVYANKNGVTLEVDPCDQPLPVSINTVEIEQVIVNVLRNAVESGDGVSRTWIRMGRRGRRVFVEARDDGPGIARENISRLFDPFFTTRMGEGGTGLGLSVAHGILVSHGGTIGADSSPGRGTCVTIELPIFDENDDGTTIEIA